MLPYRSHGGTESASAQPTRFEFKSAWVRACTLQLTVHANSSTGASTRTASAKQARRGSGRKCNRTWGRFACKQVPVVCVESQRSLGCPGALSGGPAVNGCALRHRQVLAAGLRAGSSGSVGRRAVPD